MAHEGRVRLLLVEDDFHYPATLDESGLVLTPAEDATAPGVIDDAVDELIEMVMAKGGEVRFLANGSLADHQRIVALTRAVGKVRTPHWLAAQNDYLARLPHYCDVDLIEVRDALGSRAAGRVAVQKEGELLLKAAG
jgi:hypothetical protein